MTHFHQEDNKIQNLNRRAKGGSLRQTEFSQSPISRRPPPFGRRVESCMGAPACVAPFQRTLALWIQQKFKIFLQLAARILKVSPNLLIEAAPNWKSRFFGRGSPRQTQFHGGFLADDVEVRRAERGIKPNGKMNRIPFGFIANFLHFAEGKTSKFPAKKSDNFPALSLLHIFTKLESAVCPKAITQ